MRILILGGTRFFGSFLTELALECGHEVTLLHRGQSRVVALDGAERLHADRRDGHALLANRNFDAVVDTSGYSPAVVADAARTLEPRAGRYLFVSSISAYAESAPRGVEESAELATLPPEIEAVATSDLHWQVDLQYYGGLKAAAERAVAAVFGGERTTIIRPGLIVGPRDYTHRFNHWVLRLAEEQELLAPAPADAPAQVIDARDLAGFALHLIEQGRAGTFNANGESRAMSALLQDIAVGVGSRARVIWVAPDFLTKRGVEPWTDLPLWLPVGSALEAMNDVSTVRARAAGLQSRPLSGTARDTLAWLRATPPETRPKCTSLPIERERALLAEWAGTVFKT
jgi:2'-hydroxyisoflavone reductase